MRRCIVLSVAALGWVAACSGDLFHSTDWTPPCAGDGCGGSGEGGSGVGGTGEGGSGAGGAGGAGATGGGGAASSGGAGGSGGCQTCADALADGSQTPIGSGAGGAGGGQGGGGQPDSAFCPGSADLYDSLGQSCACMVTAGCDACVDTLCVGAKASDECLICATQSCGVQLDACQADEGGA